MKTARKHGFTLVELLVVIAVIGLLVSILAPTFTQAKRSGRQGVCLNNLEKLGQAFTARGANQGLGQFAPFAVASWAGDLMGYASSERSILQCPEETRTLDPTLNAVSAVGSYSLQTYNGSSFLYNMPMEAGPCCRKENVTPTGYDLSFEDQRTSNGTEASFSDHSFANPIMRVEVSGDRVTMSVKGGGGGYIWNLISPDGKVLIPSVMKTSPAGTAVTVTMSPFASYGINSIAEGFRPPASYLTFLDYQASIAYVVDNNHAADNWDDWMLDGEYVFARHFGKVNLGMADGSVRPLVAVEDIDPTGKPERRSQLWGQQQ